MTSTARPSTTRSSSTHSTASRVAAGLGVAGLALTLAACGSSAGDHDMGSMGEAGGMSHSASPSPSSSSSADTAAGDTAAGDHNDADVTFVEDMVVHHEGAIAMADLATDRAGDQRVKDLAARIRAAQGPEVQQMTGWLQAWGEPTTSSMEGMDHSGHGAMGMMTEEQTAQLTAASGAAFDRMFLQMMVVHHQGAVEMAQQEQTAGASPEAKALASSVVTSQTAEIAEMQQLLTSLG